MQPSPCMPGSCNRVTEQGSHPDTGTLLDREVCRSTSIKPLSAGGLGQTLTSWMRSFGALEDILNCVKTRTGCARGRTRWV